MPNRFSVEEVRDRYTNYDVQNYIDSGGFKDVFHAKDGEKDVVIKLIPIESRQMLRRAEREARAMEKIESPVFVDLIEHFVDEIDEETTYVIVEDYVPGDTLRRKIDYGDSSLSLGLNVAKSLLTVLPEIDRHDLVHRDIKPSNIIITPANEVVLLDAGIVRFQEEESLTPDHASRGPSTPQYAAPEVLENDKDAQDVRTDLFSTGIVIFETITGEHPYDHTGMTKPEAIQNDARKELNGFIDNQEVEEMLNSLYQELTNQQPHERHRKPEFALSELDLIMGDAE